MDLKSTLVFSWNIKQLRYIPQLLHRTSQDKSFLTASISQWWATIRKRLRTQVSSKRYTHASKVLTWILSRWSCQTSLLRNLLSLWTSSMRVGITTCIQLPTTTPSRLRRWSSVFSRRTLESTWGWSTWRRMDCLETRRKSRERRLRTSSFKSRKC